MKIYMWPNGDWCTEDNFESFSECLSDDYQITTVEDSVTEEDIEAFVLQLVDKGAICGIN